MTQKKVLQDHKRQGKILIPPFTSMLGPVQEVSWVKTIMPELIWIALIQDSHGHREGVRLVTSIARVARELMPPETPRIFGAVSSFVELTTDAQGNLRDTLLTSGDLFQVQEALLPLITFYPECPLQFLFAHKPQNEQSPQYLNRIKTIIGGLYDKTSRDAMMTQATMIWLAFDSGLLKVFKDLALARFPEIEDYPYTEISREIAASIRSSISMFFGNDYYPTSSDWPRYFWNRGLEIDGCYFKDADDD